MSHVNVDRPAILYLQLRLGSRKFKKKIIKVSLLLFNEKKTAEEQIIAIDQ